MKTISEMVAVMQHFADGGEVEKHYGVDGWEVVFNPAWNWSTQDYRIKPPVDPYAELKAAAKDPTKQIRCRHENSCWGDWQDNNPDWGWHLAPERYEIRDKPKPMKKVKLLAWFDGCALFWREERYNADPTWDRVPSEDKEIEVEE